jgi:hypothetical protein
MAPPALLRSVVVRFVPFLPRRRAEYPRFPIVDTESTAVVFRSPS